MVTDRAVMIIRPMVTVLIARPDGSGFSGQAGAIMVMLYTSVRMAVISLRERVQGIPPFY